MVFTTIETSFLAIYYMKAVLSLHQDVILIFERSEYLDLITFNKYFFQAFII